MDPGRFRRDRMRVPADARAAAFGSSALALDRVDDGVAGIGRDDRLRTAPAGESAAIRVDGARSVFVRCADFRAAVVRESGDPGRHRLVGATITVIPRGVEGTGPGGGGTKHAP